MTQTTETNTRPEHLPGADAIPDTLDGRCRDVTATDVARKMQRGELATGGTPGRCRFCGRSLPVSHVRVDLPMPSAMPVLQCDRVARLWERANELQEQWRGDAQPKTVANRKSNRKWEV